MTPLVLESHNVVEADAIEPLSAATPVESAELQRIEQLNDAAELRWKNKLSVEDSLTRSLVSFQANKGRAVYRWFKYKEGFSAGLVECKFAK